MEQINKTTKTDIYKIDPRAIVVEAGFNSRSDFGDIEELASQIKEQGMLNPITVVPFKDENGVEKYRLVDGERRYRATMFLIQNGTEVARVPALFASKNLSPAELLTQQLLRNEGKPFSEYEYGVAFDKFRKLGFEPCEIAAKLGIKQWKVDCCLAHLERDERVQKLMRDGNITGVDVRHIYQAAKDEEKAVKQILKLAEKADAREDKKISLKDLDLDADYNVVKDTAAVKKGLSALFTYIDLYSKNGKYDLGLDIYSVFDAITKGKKNIKEVFEEAARTARKAS